MLSTYIAYGLIMGRSATILASFSFRRQTFKQRFAIIRGYLVCACVMLIQRDCMRVLHLQRKACIKEDLQKKVIKFYEYTVSQYLGGLVKPQY